MSFSKEVERFSDKTECDQVIGADTCITSGITAANHSATESIVTTKCSNTCVSSDAEVNHLHRD